MLICCHGFRLNEGDKLGLIKVCQCLIYDRVRKIMLSDVESHLSSLPRQKDSVDQQRS